MKRVVISLLLSFMLVFNAPIKSYASAGTLVVEGGTIATGGLAAGALAGLAGPAVVIVFASMMAVGIDVELTQQSQAAGMTKTQFLKTKIEQYCREANITAGVFYKGILSGSSVMQNGVIKLANQASKQIKQFCNWLFNNNLVLDNTSTGTENTITIDNLNCPYGNQFTYTDNRGFIWTINTTENVAFVKLKISSTSACVACVSDKSFRYEIVNNGDIMNQFQGTHYHEYFYQYDSSKSVPLDYDLGLPLVDYGSNTGSVNIKAFIDTITDWSPGMSNTGVTDTFTGTRDNYNTNSPVLDPVSGRSTTINPGLIGSIPVPADTDVTVNVQDYLDALDKILSGLQDVTVGSIDQATGIPIEMDIPDTVVIDPTITKEDDDQYTPRVETPITDEDEPINPDVSPNLASEPLKFDLRNIFPFCIPFDIKDMLGLLSSEPVAPSYHVQWDIPIVNTQLDFTVDLSSFNSVALILRKMEILAFVIGLAIITRNLIRG